MIKSESLIKCFTDRVVKSFAYPYVNIKITKSQFTELNIEYLLNRNFFCYDIILWKSIYNWQRQRISTSSHYWISNALHFCYFFSSARRRVTISLSNHDRKSACIDLILPSEVLFIIPYVTKTKGSYTLHVVQNQFSNKIL